MKPPIIAISCDYHAQIPPMKAPRVEQNQDYATRIAEAGGIPFLLPLEGDPEAIADAIDGWLIPGGNDIPPEEYRVSLTDQELQERSVTLVTRKRYDFEKKLLPFVRARQKPILGVCYGCQFLNVQSGGTLITDLATENPQAFDHKWKGDPQASRHPIEAQTGSQLYRIARAQSYETVSSHHQAIAVLGEGLKASAFAADGVIEAIESERGEPFLLGVQWHPERNVDSSQDRALFTALVEAAQNLTKV